MNKPKLVLIGNGMAGIRTLEELLALAPDHYEITVFGAEPHPNYNRIMLSPVLAGELAFDSIVLNDLSWYQRHGIDLHIGRRIVAIDRERCTVTADDGSMVSYDRLLIATGSRPVMLPLPGKDLAGVLAYRDIADTEQMIAAAACCRRAIVIGGGLLGLEAAYGLKQRGMEVDVIHLGPWLLERQLDRQAAQLLQTSLEARGIRFHIGRQTQELVDDGRGRVGAVRLRDGDSVPAELVVMAVGIRPEVELAEAAGLQCNNGIVVSDSLQTFDARIYAVGECVNHRGVGYGLVAPLFEMAKVAAKHLAGIGGASYPGSQLATRLKVSGIDLFSAGDYQGGDDCEEVILSDAGAGVYKKLVLRADKLVGVCLYGDTGDGAWYFKLMREERTLSDLRERLIFGETSLGDGGHQGQNRGAAMADSDEVCGCNGVCKGTIVKAIKEKGLFCVDDVKKHTKAASSCGSCTGLVEQILSATLGSDFQQAPKRKAMCGCTDLSHAEVRAAIRDRHLLDIPATMRELQWRSGDGCSSCRPALNYYLISTWPHEARDDPQSRFINERAHANIQKDGRFSVIPQMKGGVTTPAELRRIADVADKYRVEQVKVTGGQRIDLLGVNKEDLPAIWSELGMNSGHGYGKSLRTVKTCVGSRFCRFGTQDSTGMGIALETMLATMWSPHKVKLAVSGCPRNCAEAGIKDVGVVAVDSGWEIYVGGNGGIKTEVAQFLVKVKTGDEVLLYSAAFLQLYREEAFYLERTVHFIERVGLDYIKAQVVDDAEQRDALARRLHFALDGVPDPWRARVDDAALRQEFTPLPVGRHRTQETL
ncbi:nitrite reductase large subunit NirB [Paludibacterium yongneupense]|uniref:nitrite reductase large subunit NirB n=1 Tax=Paludibacterium yongneupense TaxID=400061 RepID=UPI00042359A2|nr:nitrite reductase large subunit NirB [Paludibacterium yongneupense]